MRGSLFRKNVIKDYFERTYATALVMIEFLLFDIIEPKSKMGSFMTTMFVHFFLIKIISND